MLFFGGLQHRQYTQNLLTGQVYILRHSPSVAVTPSCSTPFTPLKFKSETLIYPLIPHQYPIRYKTSVHLHLKLTKLTIIYSKFTLIYFLYKYHYFYPLIILIQILSVIFKLSQNYQVKNQHPLRNNLSFNLYSFLIHLFIHSL